MYFISFLIFYCSAIAHELSHGFAARKIGDNTALMAGRLSINPIKHISLVGTILVPGAMLALGGKAAFGWVKPVPINFDHFNRRQKIRVILAGVFTNCILAIAGFNLFLATNNFMTPESAPWVQVVCTGLFLIFPINLMLAIFHLLPLAPLDGWALIKAATNSENAKWTQHPITKLCSLFISFLLIRIAIAIIKPLIQWAIYFSV